MTAIRGIPGSVDDVGAAYQNFIEDDRAQLWDSLGGRQGILRGFGMTLDVGTLSVTFDPGACLIEERGTDITGNGRGYHAFEDTAFQVTFDPPSAGSRSDAVVFAWADPQYGALGAEVSGPGPQVVVVTGVSGSTVPRTDTEINTAIGPGGWFRFADVVIDPADTQVNPANVTKTLGRTAKPFMSIVKNGSQDIPNAAYTQLTGFTVVEDDAGMFDASTNQWTVPVTGRYLVAYSGAFASNSTGERIFGIFADGGAAPIHRISGPGGPTNTPRLSGSWIVTLNAGEVYELRAWQNSGGLLGVASGVGETPEVQIELRS